MPVRRSVASASRLISSGPPAPPTIPVQSMPANEPWLAVAVFNANEKTIEYIMDMQHPIAGNAIMAIPAVPKSAAVSNSIEIRPEI